MKSDCCKAEMITVNEDEGTCYFMCKKCGSPCDQYVEPSKSSSKLPSKSKSAAEPKYDWHKELELNFYPYIEGGQGFALKRFIEGLLTRQKKELVDWAKKNYVDIKGGEGSAGHTPQKWTFYIRSDDLTAVLEEKV